MASVGTNGPYSLAGERAAKRCERRCEGGGYASGETTEGPSGPEVVLASLPLSAVSFELPEDASAAATGGGCESADEVAVGGAAGGVGVSPGGGGIVEGGDGGVTGEAGRGGDGDGNGGEVTVGTVTVGGGAGGIVTVTVVVGTWPSALRASASAEPEPATTSVSPAASQAARRPPSRGARMPLL